jgi:hypothetical protein
LRLVLSLFSFHLSSIENAIFIFLWGRTHSRLYELGWLEYLTALDLWQYTDSNTQPPCPYLLIKQTVNSASIMFPENAGSS